MNRLTVDEMPPEHLLGEQNVRKDVRAIRARARMTRRVEKLAEAHDRLAAAVEALVSGDDSHPGVRACTTAGVSAWSSKYA